MKVSIVIFCVILISAVHCDVIPKFFKNVGDFIDCNYQSCQRKTYYASDLKLNWIEAQLTCRSYFMNLLSIHTLEEFEHVTKIVRDNPIFETHTYIGGTNLLNNSWYWIGSSKPMNQSAFKWFPGEPNGQATEEYCTTIANKYGDIGVNDVECRASPHLNPHIFKFICEKSD